MMKMVTSEGSPLRQGVGTGSRLVFGGYRGLRRRNSRSLMSPDHFRVYGYIYIYRRKKSVRGATRGPRGWGRAQGVGRASLPHGFLIASLTYTPSLLDCFRSKNNSHEGFIPFALRLIFLFCKALKQGKKQELALGSGLIG